MTFSIIVRGAFEMNVTKRKSRVKLLCLVMILVVAVGFIILRSNSSMLAGVFTNGKSDDCPSFFSVEFREDRFVAIMNIPVTPHEGMTQDIINRIQVSEEGIYFIQIMQEGNFLISNDVYTEGITLLFPCGSVRHHPFSSTRNTITVGQSHLIALR